MNRETNIFHRLVIVISGIILGFAGGWLGGLGGSYFVTSFLRVPTTTNGIEPIMFLALKFAITIFLAIPLIASLSRTFQYSKNLYSEFSTSKLINFAFSGLLMGIFLGLCGTLVASLFINF